MGPSAMGLSVHPFLVSFTLTHCLLIWMLHSTMRCRGSDLNYIIEDLQIYNRGFIMRKMWGMAALTIIQLLPVRNMVNLG